MLTGMYFYYSILCASMGLMGLVGVCCQCVGQMCIPGVCLRCSMIAGLGI